MGSEVAKESRKRKLSPGPGMAAKDVAAHQLARIYSATARIVAEQGYKALRVRDVVGYAEVSTRAFYELFGNKESCFLQAYDRISRRASEQIIAAQADEPDLLKRPQLVLEEFIRGVERKPEDARLALIEVYAANVESLELAWQMERAFRETLSAALARDPSGLSLPPLVIEGMIGGIASVSRDRLRNDETVRLAGESEELLEWAWSLIDPLAAGLAHLDGEPVSGSGAFESIAGASASDFWTSSGDRARILRATAEMAATKGYSYLTAPRIRAAAGFSRTKFNAYFDNVEECYLNVVDQRTGEALARAARAQSRASSWGGGVYRAIASLCEFVGNDAFLSKMCLDNDFPVSANGVRSRRRLVGALTELFSFNMPPTSPTVTEASAGALWSLFHHHVIRDLRRRNELTATLAYLALAPTVGASGALASIRREQRH